MLLLSDTAAEESTMKQAQAMLREKGMRIPMVAIALSGHGHPLVEGSLQPAQVGPWECMTHHVSMIDSLNVTSPFRRAV